MTENRKEEQQLGEGVEIMQRGLSLVAASQCFFSSSYQFNSIRVQPCLRWRKSRRRAAIVVSFLFKT